MQCYSCQSGNSSVVLNCSVPAHLRSVPCLCSCVACEFQRVSLLSLVFPTLSIFRRSFLLTLWPLSWSFTVQCCHTVGSTSAAKWWEKNNLNFPHTLWTTGTSFLSSFDQKGFYLTILDAWVVTTDILAMQVQVYD